ncbi:MAG: hypothetical protein KDI02_06815 [Anaerolineae bacterium]|nr:hypothetical protein [Anaerolineae bacterium]MCB0223380.1 hypothetical protein [Anaerolineae bacterium]
MLLSWSILHRLGPATGAWMVRVSLGMVLILALATISRADTPLKPTGSAETEVSIWVPEGALPEPASLLITADYLPVENLPPGITAPPGTVGSPITFGIWQGDSQIYTYFNPSLVINIQYNEEDVPPEVLDKEQSLHLFMYHPGLQTWIKLCTNVQIDENVLSAALARVVPAEEQGSVLLAIAPDNSPPLTQEVSGDGVTEITPANSDLRFQVQSGSTPDGTHFVMTVLPQAPVADSLQLLSDPVDIKACHVDHTNPTQETVEMTTFFFKPPRVIFSFDADTLSRAGRTTNLTVAGQFDNQNWIDLEAFGSRVVRERRGVAVDTPLLGTFSLATR